MELKYKPIKSKSTLIGHKDWVRCLIKLQDGRIASASTDYTIKFWNIQTNQLTTSLRVLSAIQSLIQLTDGRLASSSNSFIITIWNKTTLKPQVDLYGHSQVVMCLVQLPIDPHNANDITLASGSYDKTIKLWSINAKLNQYNIKATLIGHTNTVWCVIVLISGQLASCSSDKTIKLWNTKTFECESTIVKSNGFVLSLVQMSNGIIVFFSIDKAIRQLNVVTHECKEMTNPNIMHPVCGIQLLNGKLAIGSSDGFISVMSIEENKDGNWNGSEELKGKELLFEAHRNQVKCLVQLDNSLIVSCSYDSTIKVWDLK